MRRMGATTRAELLDRELFGLPLFVACGRIITPFASVALQANQVPHQLSPRQRRRSSPRTLGKAHDGNRTHDLFLTKEVLYRLSYVGIRDESDMERETGFEPATPSLEGSRSTN